LLLRRRTGQQSTYCLGIVSRRFSRIWKLGGATRTRCLQRGQPGSPLDMATQHNPRIRTMDSLSSLRPGLGIQRSLCRGIAIFSLPVWLIIFPGFYVGRPNVVGYLTCYENGV